MAKLDESLMEFRADSQALLDECERFAVLCRTASLHREHASKLRAMIDRAAALKSEAISFVAEEYANELLGYEGVLGALAHELEMYAAFKEDDAGAAWAHLVDAQMAAAQAVKAHPAMAFLERAYIPRLYALERLLFPTMMFLSTAFVVEDSECSICGKSYGDCDHIKGRPYMGQLCARVVTKASIREVSLVEEPASKHCRIEAVTDSDGVARDPLSLKILEPDRPGSAKGILAKKSMPVT